mgnify:FL=1|tara:strand:- start:3793 stop:3963 length:171 start_codon:yes stop_codon:yes gene_type:complete
MEAILDAHDYNEFKKKVDILKNKGIDLNHRVNEDGGKYKVLIETDLTVDELDNLTE